MEEVAGKVALVTGGAKRLGRAVCLGLAEAGIAVVVHYWRSKKEAEGLCEEIKRKGGEAWSVGCDLAFEGAWNVLFQQTLERTGRVDYLINNASSFPKNKLWEVSAKEFQEQLVLNSLSPFFLGREFASRCLREKRKGCIVNLLDSAILHFCPDRSAYQLSKQVLFLLTRNSALAFAPLVRVNAVAPGFILPPEGAETSYLNERSKEIPLRKVGTPEDVAQCVLFMLRSDFITGQVVFVDGGHHMSGRVFGT